MRKGTQRSFVILLVALMLPFRSFAAAPASPSPAPGGTDFEIPLSDLKKVEKKVRKSEGKRHRGRKKAEQSGQGEAETVKAPEAAAPSASVPNEPTKTASPKPQETMRQAAAGVRIAHEPNSYVVAGKRTVVMAIVSSPEPFRSVRCQFRVTEGTGYASVAMGKEAGRQFTYSGIIPALTQGGRTLRYRFVAVDDQGKETLSPEYVIPVKTTSVVPGWQQEGSQEMIRVDLEGAGNPLEGFSDVTVKESRLPAPKP